MDERHTRMSSRRRRADLQKYLLKVGTSSPQDLADRYEVSLVTIHRDLDALEQQHLVRKHHGSVSSLPVSAFENNIWYRRELSVPEKQAIARKASEYIEPGMTIVLDDSTTTNQIVPLLEGIVPLTVITNCLSAILALRETDGIDLISLGGEYSVEHDGFIGAPCVAGAEALHADLGFYSFSGLDAGNVYHQDHVTVLTKRALIGIAKERIVLVDHLKLGRGAVHRVAPVTDFQRVITDWGADERAVADIVDRDVPVVRALAKAG